MKDLRFAFRQLRKTPGFSFIAVLTLALGIGANTSIFSVVNAVLLRPLPYPEPNRLVIVSESDSTQPTISVSFPDYVDWRRDNTVFEQLAVSRHESFNLSGLEGREPEQISGAVVSANFFKVIGLAPQRGRVFTEEEDRLGGPLLAVISDHLWQRLFNRNPNAVGQTLNFGNQPYTIIGVMPPQMFSPRSAEVWMPLMRRSDNIAWQNRDNHPGLFGWGRLKRGVTVEMAKAELKTIAARLEQQYPASNAHVGANVTALLENQVGEYRSSLNLLLGSVAVVLLIACANLANLLAARGAARSREFAIRVAIGATRWQIIRQLLIESLVLALIGGLLGAFLATWGRDLLVALSPHDARRFQETRIDGWVLTFTASISILTSLLFGLWPAWHTSRADAQSALKAGAHGSSDAPAARRSREFLIVLEVALTLLLLSAAALVLKSFSRTTALQLGFQPHDLLSGQISLPSPAYEDHTKLINFSNSLVEKLRELPGVQAAAIASNPPFMTGWQSGFLAEGQAEPPSGEGPSGEMTTIAGDYFQSLGISLVRGRSFDARDTKDAPRVVIVDQALADRYFPGQDPIGKRIRMSTDESGPRMITIVGVAPRLKVYGFNEISSLSQIYLPQTQVPTTDLVVLLRTSLSVSAMERTLREVVSSLDPSQPIYDIRPMQERVEETWATPRLMTFLLITFAALALTLALVGLYGVMAYNGLRRMREIGVRLALGAQRPQIVSMMLRQGMRLLVFGLAIGFGGALILSRLMRSLLFEVNASDPFTYLGVSVLLLLAAAFACWIPGELR